MIIPKLDNQLVARMQMQVLMDKDHRRIIIIHPMVVLTHRNRLLLDLERNLDLFNSQVQHLHQVSVPHNRTAMQVLVHRKLVPVLDRRNLVHQDLVLHLNQVLPDSVFRHQIHYHQDLVRVERDQELVDIQLQHRQLQLHLDSDNQRQDHLTRQVKLSM